MDVSFIIPAYNAEKYIQRCLNSILNQPFVGEFEVIVVDDCSTDKTLAIIESYQLNDNRVKVFKHTVNKKVSKARQTGLSYAAGEYIWYIDADDWIQKDILQNIYNKATEQQLDVLLLPMRLHDGMSIGKELVVYKKQQDSYFIPQNFVGAMVCKFVKRSCLNIHYVSFEKSYGLGEDFLMAMELFYNISKIDLFEEVAYFYFVNMQSSTKSAGVQKFATNFLENIVPLSEMIKSRYKEKDFLFYYKVLLLSALTKILEIRKCIQCSKRDEIERRLSVESNRYVDLLGYKKIKFHTINIIVYKFKKTKSFKSLLKDIYYSLIK